MPTSTSAPLPAVRALLASAIDFAGLFPPAELNMDVAVDHYLTGLTSADSWALGRLVVPVSRFPEFESSLSRIPAPWPRISVSALIGVGTADDVDTIERFNRKHVPDGARVDAVEVKAPSPGVARAVLAALPQRLNRYLEVSLGEVMPETLDVISAGGAFAKVRTGGTSPDAFPQPELLMAFLEAAALRKLPFKATAGLHHPVRGAYRLTYAKDAASATMHGYLNLFIASAALWGGGLPGQALQALLEEDASAFWINGDAIVWRDHRFPTGALREMRKAFVHGFGSCSFTEPVEELTLRNAK